MSSLPGLDVSQLTSPSVAYYNAAVAIQKVAKGFLWRRRLKNDLVELLDVDESAIHSTAKLLAPKKDDTVNFVQQAVLQKRKKNQAPSSLHVLRSQAELVAGLIELTFNVFSGSLGANSRNLQVTVQGIRVENTDVNVINADVPSKNEIVARPLRLMKSPAEVADLHHLRLGLHQREFSKLARQLRRIRRTGHTVSKYELEKFRAAVVRPGSVAGRPDSAATASPPPMEANWMVRFVIPYNDFGFFEKVLEMVDHYNEGNLDHSALMSHRSGLASQHVFVLTEVELRRLTATTTIQSLWRSHKARKSLKPSLGERLIRQRAAKRVQRWWKRVLFQYRIKFLSELASLLGSIEHSELFITRDELNSLSSDFNSRLTCFPEHKIEFHFDVTELVHLLDTSVHFGRKGFPLWLNLLFPMISQEDAVQIRFFPDIVSLVTLGTSLIPVKKPVKLETGVESDCLLARFPSLEEARNRAALLLLRTWDPKNASGIRLHSSRNVRQSESARLIQRNFRGWLQKKGVFLKSEFSVPVPPPESAVGAAEREKLGNVYDISKDLSTMSRDVMSKNLGLAATGALTGTMLRGSSPERVKVDPRAPAAQQSKPENRALQGEQYASPSPDGQQQEEKERSSSPSPPEVPYSETQKRVATAPAKGHEVTFGAFTDSDWDDLPPPATAGVRLETTKSDEKSGDRKASRGDVTLEATVRAVSAGSLIAVPWSSQESRRTRAKLPHVVKPITADDLRVRPLNTHELKEHLDGQAMTLNLVGWKAKQTIVYPKLVEEDRVRESAEMTRETGKILAQLKVENEVQEVNELRERVLLSRKSMSRPRPHTTNAVTRPVTRALHKYCEDHGMVKERGWRKIRDIWTSEEQAGRVRNDRQRVHMDYIRGVEEAKHEKMKANRQEKNARSKALEDRRLKDAQELEERRAQVQKQIIKSHYKMEARAFAHGFARQHNAMERSVKFGDTMRKKENELMMNRNRLAATKERDYLRNARIKAVTREKDHHNAREIQRMKQRTEAALKSRLQNDAIALEHQRLQNKHVRDIKSLFSKAKAKRRNPRPGLTPSSLRYPGSAPSGGIPVCPDCEAGLQHTHDRPVDWFPSPDSDAVELLSSSPNTRVPTAATAGSRKSGVSSRKVGFDLDDIETSPLPETEPQSWAREEELEYSPQDGDLEYSPQPLVLEQGPVVLPEIAGHDLSDSDSENNFDDFDHHEVEVDLDNLSDSDEEGLYHQQQVVEAPM